MTKKIINWLKSILAATFGILQAFLKLGKEIITGAIDIISLLIPFSTSQAIIEWIRERFNDVDNFIEIGKRKLLAEIV